MKVYKATHITKQDFKEVPQIKIKNEELRKIGFDVGKEFSVTYKRNKIILKILASKNN